MGISVFRSRSATGQSAIDPAAAALVGVAFLTLAVWAVARPMGHFSIDEGLYHFMTRAFAEEGRLAVWNGYTEFSSDALVLQYLRVHEGLLFPQYPSFLGIIAAPFYAVFGFSGLFLLNALAYVGCLGLCIALAQALFGDRKLSLVSGLILVFSTFSWEYSQAAWPHAVSAFLAVSAVYLTVLALKAQSAARSAMLGTAAGLVVGVGVGVRLDAMFLVPAITIPFLFAKPWKPATALLAGLGTLPGLIGLAFNNLEKFGVFSPFSYGAAKEASAAQLGSYLPLAAIGVAGLALVFFATRPQARALMADRRWRHVAVISAIGLAVLCLALGWQTFVRWIDGFYQLVVDLRVRDPSIAEGGLMRGPGGGMIYIGNLKKSLLQSCPYLVVLAVPLVHMLRGGERALRLAVLFLAPAAFIGVYSYFAWHGGQCLNLRYFVPILPFTSILAAYSWRELSIADPRVRQVVRVCLTALLLAIGGAYLLWGVPDGGVSHIHEFILLTLPLCIALILLVLTVAVIRRGGRDDDATRWMRASATAVFLCGMIWSGTFAFAYDMPAAFKIRKARALMAETAAPLISPDSLLLQAGHPDTLFPLLQKPRVRLGVVVPDRLDGLRALVEHHLDAGRPAYFWIEFVGRVPDEVLNAVTPLQFEQIAEIQVGKLYRIRRPSASYAPRSTAPARGGSGN